MTPADDMHVAIDLRVLDRKGMAFGGLSRYGVELATGLAAVRPQWRLTFFSNRPALLAREHRGRVRSTRWPTTTGTGRVAWLHAGSAFDAAARSADVWFSPSFVLPIWRRRPSVVAIHDLAFQLLPGHYRGGVNTRYATVATRVSARRATRVVCGSEETKRLLGELLGIDPEKVDVMHYGASETFFSQDGARPRALDSQLPYILAVGTFEARKGLEILHSAARIVNAGGPRVRLVLAGQPGWGTAELVSELQRDPAVEFRIRVPDSELARLYREALALVYPSRMEGFGLPVAEAMAARCPVIASDLACIREFAGDVPLYAPVGDGAAIADHVCRLLDDPAEAAHRTRAGAHRAGALRWDSAAEAAARVIERAAG